MPRSFRGITDPSGVVRARAAGLGEGLPQTVVIPALIGRLDDPDTVVQLSANEELKRVTGQDFGFRAWNDLEERRAAVERWRSWWNRRQAGLGSSRQKY